MGCMLGRERYDDDDIYIRDGRHRHHHNHHHRAHRRVVPRDNYCLLCRCEQYSQRHAGSNHCFCGHTPGEHKRV